MSKQGKILVVDIDPSFTKVLRVSASLVDRGVTFASSRDEALHLARSEKPDLIIVGYLEPRGESFLLHEEFKRNPDTKHIPMLVVDVNTQAYPGKGWHKDEGLRMRAEDYLCRPVSAQKLALHMESLLNSRNTIDVDKVLFDARRVDISLFAAQFAARRNLRRIKVGFR